MGKKRCKIKSKRVTNYLYNRIGVEERTVLDNKIKSFLTHPPFVGSERTRIATRGDLETADPRRDAYKVGPASHKDPICYCTMAELIELSIQRPRLLSRTVNELARVRDCLYRLSMNRDYIPYAMDTRGWRAAAKTELIAAYNHFKGDLWLNESDPYVYRHWSFGVRIGPVTLRGLRLGSFIVGLQGDSALDRRHNPLTAYPVKPLWAAANYDVRERSICHPHVKDYMVCLGEVNDATINHLAAGRYMSAMYLTELIMRSCHTTGAFRELAKWHTGYEKTICSGCRRLYITTLMKKCIGEDCLAYFCDSCTSGRDCPDCGCVRCDNHVRHCISCDKVVCTYCGRLEVHHSTPLFLCPSCWRVLWRMESGKYSDLRGKSKDEIEKAVISLRSEVRRSRSSRKKPPLVRPYVSVLGELT